MTRLVLVIDDEPDIEILFCQHFRKELRAGGAEGILAKPIEFAILRAEIFSRLDAAT